MKRYKTQENAIKSYTIAERTLPDGRQAFVSLLITGTARLYVCNAQRPLNIDAEY